MHDTRPAARRDTRTYRQLRDDPKVPEDVRNERLIDETLGLMATVLIRRGSKDVAAVLGRVARIEIDYREDGWTSNESPGIWLEYEPEDAEGFLAFDEEIRDTFSDVTRRASLPLDWISTREVLPEVSYGWKQQLADALDGKKLTNQANRVRPTGPHHVHDHLAFTNAGEATVYRALKNMQEKDLPHEETLSIFPLPMGRFPGHTWEPDFLIAYRGRVGILEVDGPHHNGRRANDTSRDHLMRDAGIAHVDRVTVEAVGRPSELDAFIRRFLRRLTETR